jgi:hypothetical protein
VSDLATDKGVLKFVKPHWDKIRLAAARSLKKPAKSFLPPLEDFLGVGAWGIVWPTADKRFVLKASVDPTEGQQVAAVMKYYQRHPGVAYFHRLWRLPREVWVDNLQTPVWIMLREEVDVEKSAGRRVYGLLDKIQDCSGTLIQTAALRRDFDYMQSTGIRAGLDKVLRQLKKIEGARKKDERCYLGLLSKLKKTKGKRVARLIEEFYKELGVVMADVHEGNVAFRRHNLRPFKVVKHGELVLSDLGGGDLQPVISGSDELIGMLDIAVLKNPIRVLR